MILHNSKLFLSTFLHRDYFELNKLVVMAWALKLPLADEVIESGLVQDFDASLSGIGQELGAGAYSMRYRLSFCFKIHVSIPNKHSTVCFTEHNG